eukprot:m.63884 g.63884  ORF g.63884 m.63884 type:complete len:81 (-) comp7223_c0_seq1:611-853(-)
MQLTCNCKKSRQSLEYVHQYTCMHVSFVNAGVRAQTTVVQAASLQLRVLQLRVLNLRVSLLQSRPPGKGCCCSPSWREGG